MKKLIISNWKMNPSSQKQATNLFNGLSRGLKKSNSKIEIVVCPPFPYLSIAKKSTAFKLGAQDCFWEDQGAFTGQVSLAMLKDLGVKYVICGHSEKRRFGEIDEDVNRKVRAVLGAKMTPILCVGENMEQRKNGQAFSVVEKQVKQGLKKIVKSQVSKVVIAYEPIWAISPNGPCLPDQALTMTLFLRKVVSKIGDKKTAKDIRVLYGGSINASNAKEYISSDFLSGLLVGSASLDTKEFVKITL
ncbi:MAG: triose-phosphate isomerase [Parcubacteria group bacterium]|nr:triose-phosphate isomerase [Parcubacteria group bacterium]